METVIQSLLGIVVSLSLSGCLVNTPPGVPVLPEAQAAKVHSMRYEESNEATRQSGNGATWNFELGTAVADS